MFALIDCNNFFVSCERVFRPDLEGKPTIVLSSNDGCAIARSNEAKQLGIPMGAPVFKYRQVLKDYRVMQFSANFELYGDISQRIVRLLTEITPRLEAYSIDESFLDLSELAINNYTEWGLMVRERIRKEIGMPVSIGIAPSKTLAKLASERGKKDDVLNGVLAWPDLTDHQKQSYLQATPIVDIWGIGRRLAPKLRAEGVPHALALSMLRPQLAQKLMGINGRQLVAELNGIQCHPLELSGKLQQSIMRGRTFGEDTNQFTVVQAAIATLTARAALRLRREGLLARRAGIYLQTNRHKPNYQAWYQDTHFSTPTSDTGTISGRLSGLAYDIFNNKQQYHRANIYLLDFVSSKQLQTDLLGITSVAGHIKAQARMEAMDSINTRYGGRQMRYAAENLGDSWQPKHDLRSPRYTTEWKELPIARVREY
jgi:DNA polymerase V